MTLEEKWYRAVYKLHRQDLKRRGITVEQAVERGYEPLTANETYKEIEQPVGPTIALTCYKANGKPRNDRRFRLVNQNKIDARPKKQRYTQKSKEKGGTSILIHIR